MAVSYNDRIRVKTAKDAPQIAVGLPVRKTSPVEFWISMLQMLPPLNVKLSYIIQKGADAPGGLLPAAARNEILKTALADGVRYVWFLDDDVLYPDLTLYRFFVSMQKHPEAACITGIYPTKADPCEPIIYDGPEGGAYWDWPLGTLVPIHSAGAGCMLVDMEYVKKLEPPWFNDVVLDETLPDGNVKRQTWGQDRYFHIRLREEAGGVIYADTGILCSHWDTENQKNYVLPPDAPCFQQAPIGETFVPLLDEKGCLSYIRLLPPPGGDPRFKGYLEYLQSLTEVPKELLRQSLVDA